MLDIQREKLVWVEPKRTGEGIGAQLIAEIVARLPSKPGVYRMIGENEKVLYVGKAKNLKHRVNSYARGRGHGGNRTAKMISLTHNMEFIVTSSEIEALLLEANLIKFLQPHFNILLRDDKSFPFIFISKRAGELAQGIYKHRGKKKLAGEYFGPFASTSAVYKTLESMQRIFNIRTCSDSYYKSRTRPCLQFQIKRCAAPCTGEIAPAEYDELVSHACDFLNGKNLQLKKKYISEMNEASKNLDFERAAILRDRLSAISQIHAHQDINPKHLEEADVFAVDVSYGRSCVQVFFYRNSQNWGNACYFPRADKTFSPAEILNSFIAQFYDDKPIPKCILTSHPLSDHKLIQQALCARSDKKVELATPQRGQRKKIVLQALQNATDALKRKIAETATQKKLLDSLAQKISLTPPPQRIEVYDNSHISGSDAVGAMIVASDAGFVKNQYRKFNIKSTTTKHNDDYAMMHEVLTRRFSRLVKNTNDSTWPDLVIVDGGRGQLNVAVEVLRELNIDTKIKLLAIAKGENRNAGLEKFFLYNAKSKTTKQFTLPPRDPVLYFIQRLRDEAHRFAIATHRAKRKKSMHHNPLDEIAGIGAKRKRAILNAFGSATATASAGIEDLKKVEGISHAMAETIFNHFHEN